MGDISSLTTGDIRQRYNSAVPNGSPRTGKPARAPRQRVYASETTGLVLIALILLIITLIRYWHAIHWSWR